jgi:hypothetical protein
LSSLVGAGFRIASRLYAASTTCAGRYSRKRSCTDPCFLVKVATSRHLRGTRLLKRAPTSGLPAGPLAIAARLIASEGGPPGCRLTMSAPGAQYHVDLSPPPKNSKETQTESIHPPEGGRGKGGRGRFRQPSPKQAARFRAQGCSTLTALLQGREISKREYPKKSLTTLSCHEGRCEADVLHLECRNTQNLSRPAIHREACVKFVISDNMPRDIVHSIPFFLCVCVCVCVRVF